MGSNIYNDAVRNVEYLCHTGCSMLQNLAELLPSCLYKTCLLQNEKPGTICRGFHGKVVSIFVFFFIILFGFWEKKYIIFALRRQDWLRTHSKIPRVSVKMDLYSTLYKDPFVHSLMFHLTGDFATQTLCFACTGGNAILKVSMYFSP